MNLSACSCKINYDNCPVYPKGGKKVGEELNKLSYSEYPNLWEWLARVNKLKQELDLCERK
ncbi:MAG: hypothetical protein J5896_04670 [Alphaproteobacteria bacterium]|nr:hypothetical protein [Alphaproteobacteria bacterium]